MDERTRKDIRILRAIGQDQAAEALEAIHGEDEPTGAGVETPPPATPPAEPREAGTPIGRDDALKMTRTELDQLKQVDRPGYEATMIALTGRDAAGRRTT